MFESTNNIFNESMTHYLSKSSNPNVRLTWNPVRNELVNQCNYYRDLQNSDFELYLLPNVLQAKLMFGQTDLFLITLQVYIGCILYGSSGNYKDLEHATIIQNILCDTNLTRHKIIDSVFNHSLWEL